MTVYGVIVDYDYSSTHKRERLTVWSPPWMSVFEAEGYSLPHGGGYMLTTYNGDKVRVSCPAPRTAENYTTVDAAISAALNAHFSTNGTVTLAPG
jgi:hypothetical protein